MQELLENPIVQGGAAPFVAGLVVALVLARARLGGLAVLAGFATAVALVSGFTFSPLTATRKIILCTLLAPVVGLAVDFAFKPNRVGAIVLALAAAAAALWAFWPVLAQKEMREAVVIGGTACVVLAFLVGYGLAVLADRPVESASAALMLGVGAGVLAILGASASFGLYGIAVGAGAGGLLLVMMLAGKAYPAGATLVLAAAVASGLLVSGTMVLAQLQWYAVLTLALTPVAAGLPGPARARVWLRAIVHSFYALVPAAAACALAYFGSRGPAG